jgi:plasmid maintenance system killer protein
MIKSWSDKEAKKSFARQVPSRVPSSNPQAALRELRYLDAAEDLRD